MSHALKTGLIKQVCGIESKAEDLQKYGREKPIYKVEAKNVICTSFGVADYDGNKDLKSADISHLRFRELAKELNFCLFDTPKTSSNNEKIRGKWRYKEIVGHLEEFKNFAREEVKKRPNENWLVLTKTSSHGLSGMVVINTKEIIRDDTIRTFLDAPELDGIPKGVFLEKCESFREGLGEGSKGFWRCDAWKESRKKEKPWREYVKNTFAWRGNLRGEEITCPWETEGFLQKFLGERLRRSKDEKGFITLTQLYDGINKDLWKGTQNQQITRVSQFPREIVIIFRD